jgi:N-acetyl-alpha-D-muramate 1-phosphate uridylyltransferase
MKAMILAAGRGDRMGTLTATEPKPLLIVGRVSLIERHLERLAACGVREVVINLSYRSAQIRAALGNGARWRLAIAYSDEGEPPLETGGGIIAALPLLGSEPFLLVNTDVFTAFDFATLGSDAARNTLLIVPNPKHNARGDFGLDAGVLTARPPKLTYGGIAVLDPALFAAYAPGRRALKPVLDAAIERRALRGLFYEGTWLDVGTPERLEEARRRAAAEEER